METFTAGSVVLIHFPFSDLSKTKLRPAVVLASLKFDDYILCQITSSAYTDTKSILLTDTDFKQGTLSRESFARPSKLFTANREIISQKIGSLADQSLKKILLTLVKILEQGNDK